MQSLFDDICKVSLTLDGWTSPYSDDFLAVTAHWIDQDWNLREIIMAFEPLDGPHTGENLLKSLITVINRFSLGRKILTITTDNASNMIKMLRLLDNYTTQNDNDW